MAQQAYTTTGRIHEIPPPEDGKWPKQLLILEVEGFKDPQYAAFEFFGKNAEKVRPFRRGDDVKIEWNLSGRISDRGKCWTTLSAWKIEGANGSGSAQREYKLKEGAAPDRNFSSRPEQPSRERKPDPPPSRPATAEDFEEDDIPF